MQSLQRWFVLILIGLGISQVPSVWAVNSKPLIDVYRNHNIPLIDNRFRIDPKVKKATFLLHRRPGSPSGILVRPDGSKVYSWNLPKNVDWLENRNLDIVTITHPMPGPWQALVETNSDKNAVQVMSDVALHVEPFPVEVFVGERLVLKASLLENGKPIVFGPYMDNVLLGVSVDSQGSVQDVNYTVGHKKLTALADNGKAYDGYPRDGIYTGYVKLDIPPGKYDFKVSTANDVFTRAYQQILLVAHQPYSTELILPQDDHPLELKLKINPDEIAPDSVIIDGRIYNNIDLNHHFEIRTRNAPKNLIFDLPTPKKPGTYRMNATVYANTLGGRPVVMDMPEKNFYLAPKKAPVTEADEKVVEPPPPPPAKSHWLGWTIAIVTILLILIGSGVAWIWWRKRKAFKKALEEASIKADENIELEPQTSAVDNTTIAPADSAAPGMEEDEPDLTQDDEKESPKEPPPQ
ncbi:hypothetical protein [Celerinatantimonas diazotrophica]|uniref:Uncharacterized protein (TIGR03503 family) n=1 Tax=Celerinatantimonas diazotrophica TaxID=412034 RepID=A0A4R1K3R4_9GAMM|nr:hypothetical protein [Celerinatantimonas diazotrophica]TCK58724.1 uncharacterized protein (TIGR03503 family) [Celerinatantimonas diazotrophica]CAG9297355.1 hypothetical protein CEDIAZO_02536 [Celerinatantimonas diazotrophica]